MMRIILSTFLLGLSFGFGPCVSSCGPLLLSYIAGTKKNTFKAVIVYLLFSLARISAYIALGLAVFFLGRFTEQRLFSGPFFRYILIFGGTFIMLVGILMILGKNLEFKFCQFLYRNILERDYKSILIFGLVIGLLPCAPLIVVLSYIGLVSKSWVASILYSLSFGAGTFFSPLLLLVILTGLFPKFLQDKAKIYRIFSAVCGLIIVFLGIQLIFKAF